jgi:site-specific recombinase
MPPRPPRPPFDILRAAFWLLAVLVIVTMGLIALVVTGCVVGTLTGRFAAGTCNQIGIGQLIRDYWSEILTTILALLVAGRPPPPAPPPDDEVT